jgi:VWFA-related protein
VTALAAVAAAQQAPPPAVFRLTADLVELDVSVLDSERRPVRGLKASDFTVIEDGDRPQQISAFVAVDVPAAAAPPSAEWMRDVAPDVLTNDDADRADSRLFVILFDDAMIPFEPSAIANAKSIARRVIDSVNPADRVAVVFSAGSGGTQSFTNDRARLLAAVETLNPTYSMYTLGWNTARPPSAPGALVTVDPPGPMADPDAPYRMASVQTLKSVADALVPAPQRRKVLVYISPGVTVDPTAPPVRGSVRTRMRLKEENDALAREMPGLYQRMKQGNVNMYVVDPCGLGGLDRHIAGVLNQIPILRSVTTPPPAGFDWLQPAAPPPPAFLARYASGLNREFALTAARKTGGFAILDTNDFGPGLDRVFAENASYYLIGYPVPARNRPGSEHRVQVKVNRPGMEVRARDSYVVPATATIEKEKTAPSKLARASAGPVATADLRLRAAIAPLASSGGPVVAIVLGLEHPAVTERTPQTFELETTAFTPDGQRRGSEKRQAGVVLVPREGGTPIQYELRYPYSLAPGRYELRIALARDNGRVAGSVYATVDVPDFASAPLSLSGVLVDVTPPVSGGPPRAFEALAPVSASAKREFTRGDTASAFLRVYQGGSGTPVAATVRTHLVNQANLSVADGTETLPADRFGAGRAADVRFPIPVATLAPGAYLLTFDVTAASQSARRVVRFEVR